jgi:RNA polymerase sigma-70 factor (ECF subfamily)
MAEPDLDAELPAIAAGDRDAFARWVAGAEPRVRRSLRAFAARADTEAVLQEALLRAWQLAPRCRSDGRPNGLLRLCLHAARNLALSELRRLRLAAAELEAAAHQAEADTETWRPPDPLLRQLIARCRERLAGQPARALALRLQTGGGEPDRVLAARAGMQLNTFLQNVTRARRLLAECLERAGVDLDLELA